MAQTGYTPIQLYYSTTASQAPLAASLANGELAINITDGKLYYKDNAAAVQVIGWKTVPTSAGGTGLTSYAAGDTLYYASGTTLSKLAIGASGRWLGSSGTAPQWNAPAALTKTDDTNVTLTLGGSASTALLNAASLTLGWTGTLATTRGGTGLSSFTANGIFYASSTSAIANGSALTFDGTNFSTTGTASATKFIPTGGTATGNGLYLPAANQLSLSTNGTEAIRIDASQNFGIGLTNPSTYGKLGVNGSIGLTGSQLNIYSSSDFEFVERNAYKMLFYVNSASVVANLSITGVWTNASDARYKENIVDSQYGLSTVMALKPRAYNLIDQTDKPQIGFIAQEVLDIVPEVVESTHNSITKQERYTLAYTQLIPVLTKAIQEQQAMIQTLTARVTQLEAK
jgi:hypothetical protein